MFKRSMSVILCMVMIMTIFPVEVMAADVQQSLPINDSMESAAQVNQSILTNTGLSGKASLTQDKVEGKYAVKVSVSDVPNQTSVNYTLATSNIFDVNQSSQIRLWVKPGAGAKWIKFLTNSVLIKNDKDSDGLFEVGEDLTSGKWNEVILDLTKTSSSITQAKDLIVNTNEFSIWSYDEIKSVFSPVSTIDISNMANSQTQLVNGALQFKSNGTGGYNVTPTTLISNQIDSQSTFSRNSDAYYDNGLKVEPNVPRYKPGKFGNGVWVEEGTTNLLSANQSSAETDTTGLAKFRGDETLTRDTNEKYSGAASLKVVTLGNIAWEGFTTTKIAGADGLAYSAKARVKGASGTFRFGLRAYNASGSYLGEKFFDGSFNGTWQEVKVENYIVPTGTTQLDIFVITLNTAQAITFYYDCGKIEQKAYCTSWHIGGTARNADNLFYTLANPLPKKWISCLWWKADYASTSSATKDKTLTWVMNNQGVWRYLVDYSNGTFRFYKNDGATLYSVISNITSFNASDTVFLAVEDDPITGVMKLWVGVNGGALSEYTFNNTVQITDAQKAYVGCRNTSGYEANGTIDAFQIIDISALESSGTTFNSAFINNQYTATSAPTAVPGHLLLCNYENSIDSSPLLQNTPTLPNGKISKISIDSNYIDNTGARDIPSGNRQYLAGVQPTVLAISGDGNKVYYSNPGGLRMVDLLTGTDIAISDTVASEIKVNYNGTKVVFTDTASHRNLYSYSSGDTVKTLHSSSFGNDILDFDIQDDGTIYYLDSGGGEIKRQLHSDGSAWTIKTDDSIKHIAVPRKGNLVFYNTENSSDVNKLYSLTYTNAVWGSNLLKDGFGKTESGYEIGVGKMLSNADGTLLYLNTDSNYTFHVSSKVLRKIDIGGNVLRFIDNNKLIYQTYSVYNYKLYDVDSDVEQDIRPDDAKSPASSSQVLFSVDSAGNKMAYVASGGLSTYYINGAQRPERYLFSFDGKNSWYTYKDGVWTVVKTGATPTTDDLITYGMTIDQVNTMTPADFEGLYTDGRQVLHLDVAVYFASVDAFTTPSLNGIKVYFNTGDRGEELLEKWLYTTKQHDFTATKWRKIKKIYPIEIFPKEAEAYYFIVKDGLYKTYKNNQWSDVSSTLLTNIETNWIDSTNGQGITQLGMTAEELRAIPETALQTLLPCTNLSIVCAMKVNDISTDSYSSLITIDFADNLFDANTLTLKIKFIDGTTQEYPNLAKANVEDFMEWLNGRQFNKGPIFYTIKTVSNGIEINDFINYYTVKSVSVDDSTP